MNTKELTTGQNRKLQYLFVELVKIELSHHEALSSNIVDNTIQHFAAMTPFNKITIEQWYSICSLNGVKYDL